MFPAVETVLTGAEWPVGSGTHMTTESTRGWKGWLHFQLVIAEGGAPGEADWIGTGWWKAAQARVAAWLGTIGKRWAESNLKGFPTDTDLSVPCLSFPICKIM